MTQSDVDIKTLAEAFEVFTKTTQTMEESYRRLEVRVRELDEELAAKNQELAVAGEYLKSILDSMSDGVIAVNSEGVVTTFNRAAGAVLGYAPEAVVGRRFCEVFGREFHGAPGMALMEFRTESGAVVSVAERDSPLSDRSQRRIGYVKVFQDVTELEALRERVRQKDRLAAVGEMAATVAHEIRNPLGAIRGFAALLARDISSEDARSRLVQKILAGSRDLERVVNELLEYTRPLHLSLRPTSCADLVESALGYLDLGGRPVRIENHVEPGLKVHVDPDRMRQVFLNLLLNAVQSMDGAGMIRVASIVEEKVAVVAFSDTGCGMTADQLQKAFSPFYTTKEKGTGLGLAIAAKIVEGHGGVLEAESEPGRGSTFRIRIQRAE